MAESSPSFHSISGDLNVRFGEKLTFGTFERLAAGRENLMHRQHVPDHGEEMAGSSCEHK